MAIVVLGSRYSEGFPSRKTLTNELQFIRVVIALFVKVLNANKCLSRPTDFENKKWMRTFAFNKVEFSAQLKSSISVKGSLFVVVSCSLA